MSTASPASARARAAAGERPVLPPATLGVIGGGQLGTGFARAARAMGYRVAVLDPDPGCPAMPAAHERIVAPYADPAALQRLSDLCSAVTIEFECVPAASVLVVESRCMTAPRAETVAVLQDRIREKRFLRAIGYPVVPFAPVLTRSDIDDARCYPAILKLAQQSYDGKGQVAVRDPAAARAAWRALGEVPCLLEHRLDLEAELSVVVARGANGDARAFPVAQNRVRDGVIELSVVPAAVAESLAGRASDAALRIASSLDYVGVLGVEFFLHRGELLVNEVAPRPHATGHYTEDACVTSQFEQQVRALCRLPLGETTLSSPVATATVFGDAWRSGAPDWRALLAGTAGRLHLYGKAQARPRRKMGHVSFKAASAAEAQARAETFLARVAVAPARRAKAEARRVA